MQPSDLQPHPEGGKYQEVYRSRLPVHSSQHGDRNALTHIYFQLESGEYSQFHKVRSEEVWNLYQGEGLKLYQWDGKSEHIETIILSAASQTFCHVIPADYWQAAEPLGAQSVLVGCSVAPGFEFEDFTLIHEHPELSQELVSKHPSLAHLATDSANDHD